MPPKAKFTKAEIIEAALNIVRADGYEALTSRALGTYLGSSARPIFTVFKNMEEVQQDMIKSAKALYKEYVNKGLTTEPPFKGVGTQYILFAVNEPKLFQNTHTYLSNHCTDFFVCKSAHFCGTKRCNSVCIYPKMMIQFFPSCLANFVIILN